MEYCRISCGGNEKKYSKIGQQLDWKWKKKNCKNWWLTIKLRRRCSNMASAWTSCHYQLACAALHWKAMPPPSTPLHPPPLKKSGYIQTLFIICNMVDNLISCSENENFVTFYQIFPIQSFCYVYDSHQKVLRLLLWTSCSLTLNRPCLYQRKTKPRKVKSCFKAFNAKWNVFLVSDAS